MLDWKNLLESPEQNTFNELRQSSCTSNLMASCWVWLSRRHLIPPDCVATHVSLTETWPEMQPARPNGSHALKTIVYWDLNEPSPAAQDIRTWNLCMDISLVVCNATTSNLFDMDQAVDLARSLSSGSSSYQPVHFRFLLPRDDRMFRCSILEKSDLAAFELLSRNWVFHLDDDSVEYEGGMKLVSRMLSLMLCAMGNACDPMKRLSSMDDGEAQTCPQDRRNLQLDLSQESACSSK